MNSIRLGRLVRAVRVRKRMTQRAVSRLAGVSRTTVSRLERGWISSLTLRTVERIADALEIQVDITGRWRGADGDRLINAGHAALHETVAQRFAALRDRYRRLAASIARDHGWSVRSVSVWVIMRDTPTNRRHVAQHASVLRAAFPMDGRGVRRWLRSPDRPIQALSFMPVTGAVGTGIARVRPSRRADPDQHPAR